MKKLTTLILTITSLFFLFLLPPVYAQTENCGDACIHLGDRQKSGDIPGLAAFGNPNASPGNLIGNALKIMFIFGGLAVVVFFVWGAFDWITAGGDKEKITAARRKIINSLIGLTLLMLALFIISLFGQIVGFDPLKTPPLPGLGDAAKPFQPATGTTP